MRAMHDRAIVCNIGHFDSEIQVGAQAPQKLHSVHARHLDVENGEIGRIGFHAIQPAAATRSSSPRSWLPGRPPKTVLAHA
jgi:S-adenosyl-L-homocysteine hydrolase, NAD binding domain